MATYLIPELLSRLAEMTQDGYTFTELSEFPSDEDFPVSLHFDAIGDLEVCDYEEVMSVDLDDFSEGRTVSYSVDAPCASLLFTYRELATIHHALMNALEYIKDESKKSTYSKDLIRDMKASSVEFRNLKAKIEHFMKESGFTK